MKLEEIDTSTTAGKAEVMRLAAEGRRVAFRKGATARDPASWNESQDPVWNWAAWNYAIISEPVGPDEVWVDFRTVQKPYYLYSEVDARSWASKFDVQLVRYIREDLAGEKG